MSDTARQESSGKGDFLMSNISYKPRGQPIPPGGLAIWHLPMIKSDLNRCPREDRYRRSRDTGFGCCSPLPLSYNFESDAKLFPIEITRCRRNSVMRKVIVIEFITLDGVIQAGGRADRSLSEPLRQARPTELGRQLAVIPVFSRPNASSVKSPTCLKNDRAPLP